MARRSASLFAAMFQNVFFAARYTRHVHRFRRIVAFLHVRSRLNSHPLVAFVRAD